MRRWTETAERVAATTKTSEKTAILGEYLAGLSPDELPIAAVFLTGRPFPEADQRSIGVGWAGLGGAVLRVAGADPDAMRRAYDRSSDVATAVGEVLAGGRPRPRPGGRAHPPGGLGRVRGDRGGLGRGGEGGDPRGAARALLAPDRRRAS